MAFPTSNRRGRAVSGTTNANTWSPGSWTWGTNNAVPSGQTTRWYLFVSADGSGTLTETGGAGWAKVSQTTDATNAVTSALFTLDTTAAFAAGAVPAITISDTASEQFSAQLVALTAASGKVIANLLGTTAQGSSTNANPPSVTNNTGASQDFTITIYEAGDSTTVATAAPANYTGLIGQAGGGTNGASCAQATRNLTLANAASEDPAAFTTANDQWVAWTVAAYETVPPSVDGNARGAFGATVTLSALTGSASGDAAASGALSGVTVTAMGGGATGTAAATGAMAGVTVTPMTGAGSGDAAASGAFGSIVTLTPMTGIGGVSANASGPFGATVILSALTGAASGDAGASGAMAGVTVTAMGGTGSGDASAQGALPGVAVTPLTGTASGDGAAAGLFGATVTVTAMTGTADGGGAASVDGNASGPFGATVNLSALGGTASGDAAAQGALSPVTVSALSGTATGDGNASGAMAGVVVSAMTGTATGDAGAAGPFGAAVTLNALSGWADGGGPGNPFGPVAIVSVTIRRSPIQPAEKRMPPGKASARVRVGVSEPRLRSGTSSGAAVAVDWGKKDPDEVRTYGVDYGSELAEGDSIASVAWTFIDAAGCTKSNEAFVGTQARVRISGGTVGQTMIAECRMTTVGGEILEDRAKLKIRTTS
jgi:hypothetical protein